MKIKVMLFVLALGFSSGYTKNSETHNVIPKKFEKILGIAGIKHINALVQTKDRGFIVVGRINSFKNGLFDTYLIKIDENGNKVWQKTFGGKSWDEANAIVPTKNDGFIVAGETNSFGNGEKDIYLIKIDKNGNKVWQKTFGGKKNDWAEAMVQTKDDGFIIVGGTGSFGNKGSAYLIKIDENGNKIWQKTFCGLDVDVAKTITQGNDSKFIISGVTFSLKSNSNGYIYLIMIDKDGNIKW